MKTKSIFGALLPVIFILSPISVHAVDSCQAVFSDDSLSEAGLKAKIESDLDYTFIKSGMKPGELSVTMESATPENLNLLRELLKTWNVELNQQSYDIFRRDFLIVRNVLNVHDFKSIINTLSDLSIDSDARLQELALAVRVKNEIFQRKELKSKKPHELSRIEKQSPNLSEALRFSKIASKHGWSWTQLSENISSAISLAKTFRIEGARYEPAIQLLDNDRPNYISELKSISTLELNYVYSSFFSNEKFFEYFSPDIHDAAAIIKRAEELNRTPEQIVSEVADIIKNSGLDSGVVVGKRVQFFDVLPRE